MISWVQRRCNYEMLIISSGLHWKAPGEVGRHPKRSVKGDGDWRGVGIRVAGESFDKGAGEVSGGVDRAQGSDVLPSYIEMAECSRRGERGVVADEFCSEARDGGEILPQYASTKQHLEYNTLYILQ